MAWWFEEVICTIQWLPRTQSGNSSSSSNSRTWPTLYCCTCWCLCLLTTSLTSSSLFLGQIHCLSYGVHDYKPKRNQVHPLKQGQKTTMRIYSVWIPFWLFYFLTSLCLSFWNCENITGLLVFVKYNGQKVGEVVLGFKSWNTTLDVNSGIS